MAFMFKALGQEELNIVVDAMEEKAFQVGQTVITEGEAGSVLYVVEEGELDCKKRLDPNVSIHHSLRLTQTVCSVLRIVC